MSSVTAHAKTTLVTFLTLRVTTASQNYWMFFNTFQSMFSHARYNVNNDAPVDIDSLYERRLVHFARDGLSPCLSRGPDTARVHLVLMIKWSNKVKNIYVLET